MIENLVKLTLILMSSASALIIFLAVMSIIDRFKK